MYERHEAESNELVSIGFILCELRPLLARIVQQWLNFAESFFFSFFSESLLMYKLFEGRPKGTAGRLKNLI